jgi:hypothetical protein
MEPYIDPIIQKYIDLIKANCGGAIKTFYQGEPLKIPDIDLPCAMISKTATRAGTLTNAEDEHSIALTITVITSIRAELSTADSMANLTAGIGTLYDIVEGRDENYALKPESLLAILRHNIAVDTANNLRTDLGSVTAVDYGTTLRNRSPEQWSIEARVNFICSFSQVR